MNLITAKIIADSISEEGVRISTIHMHYPRPIHAELMTHRVFSRNARSSRAVPVSKLIEEAKTAPYIPWHWGKNQKGMQADEECNENIVIDEPSIMALRREDAWRGARNDAVKWAERFNKAGYHKQIINRLLEPFTYIDTLVTSVYWDNFFFLRNHGDAEPHMHDLALACLPEYEKSVPRELAFGEWHLPYITEEERFTLDDDFLCKISAARCARISYAPFDGDSSYDREMERYSLLVNSPVHASPMEHQATPDRKYPTTDNWISPKMHGNLTGYIQFRKTIPNEAIMESY